MKNRSVIIWMMVVILVATGVSKAALMGYTVLTSSNSVVYLTNFDTGEQTPLGPSGISSIETLEFVNETLYAGALRELWKIDTSSGLGTLVGSTTYTLNNLAATVDGTLYGTDNFETFNLRVINADTGTITTVGALSPYVSMKAFAIDGSDKAIGWDDGAKWLFDIDLTDGATNSRGQLLGNFRSFDYGPDGTLYGWEGNRLYSIDVDSVSSTLLKTFSAFGNGITFIPEPATLSLLALGAAAMLRRRRRRC